MVLLFEIDPCCDINHSFRWRQPQTLDILNGTSDQFSSHLYAVRATVSGETLIYYQDPVSPSQLNRGDLNQQAKTHS